MAEPFAQIVDLILGSKIILLVIHQDPDGDTIASSLALAQGLEQIGIKAAIVGKDPVPEVFNFLPGSSQIKQDYLAGDYDTIIVLDCGDLKRTGFPDRLRKFAQHRKRLINIDHHRKSDLHKIANVTLFDEKAAATAQIIFELIGKLSVQITPAIATCLLCGLYTDTGGFRHANTTPKTLELASLLMERGAKLGLIRKNLGSHKSMAALRLWGAALSRINRRDDLGLVTSVITLEDMQDAKATSQDLAGLVNLINSTAGSKAAMLFSQVDDQTIKVSLRTERNDVDVSRLAEFFGGGGHKKAAGFTIDGKIKQSKNGWKIEIK